MRNRLILATIRNDETNEEKMTTFESWREYNEYTFSPTYTTLFITNFKIKGKTYKERKEYLRDITIDYSNNIASGLYWSESAEISDIFYKLGKKYGLLKEFKENAIC